MTEDLVRDAKETFDRMTGPVHNATPRIPEFSIQGDAKVTTGPDGVIRWTVTPDINIDAMIEAFKQEHSDARQ